ncbi:MAG: hypothetical protein QOH84_5254 [Kribbellaceae bacterium]|jgi:hypothetical protein|nr:hypothetical protein [Kribbellaceae bacterium]
MATSERVLSVVDATESWQEEIADLRARVETMESGLLAGIQLVLVFRGPGECVGVQVGGLDADDSALSVEVTLPHGLARERPQMLLMLLQEALDAADSYLERRGRSDDLWAAWRVMVRLTSGGTPYERWSDAYMVAHHQPDALADQPCPDCGAHQLRLEFEVRDPCANHGTAYFWCNNCLTGPNPTAAPLPPGVATTPWATLNPPNYEIISPDQ